MKDGIGLYIRMVVWSSQTPSMGSKSCGLAENADSSSHTKQNHNLGPGPPLTCATGSEHHLPFVVNIAPTVIRRTDGKTAARTHTFKPDTGRLVGLSTVTANS